MTGFMFDKDALSPEGPQFPVKIKTLVGLPRAVRLKLINRNLRYF